MIPPPLVPSAVHKQYKSEEKLRRIFEDGAGVRRPMVIVMGTHIQPFRQWRNGGSQEVGG